MSNEQEQEIKKLEDIIQEAWCSGDGNEKDKFGDFLNRAGKAILSLLNSQIEQAVTKEREAIFSPAKFHQLSVRLAQMSTGLTDVRFKCGMPEIMKSISDTLKEGK